MDLAAFEALADEVSSWGRWGDEDERGTLNLIGDASVRRGVEAATTGPVFGLSLPLDADVPKALGNKRRFDPTASLLAHDQRFMGPDDSAWSEDAIHMPLQAGTHWDALAHVSWRGQIYNGFSVDTITADGRATRCGIDKIGPLVTRGVVLDVARARGVEFLDNDTQITPDDLDAASEAAGVDPETGDVMLVRTGAMSRWLAGPGAEKKAYVTGSPGFELECVRWFADRGVAALGVDTQNPDSFPSAVDGMLMPFGVLCLRQLGMPLGQNWVLEDLAAHCDAHRAERPATCLLSAAPLPVTAGLGSPLQPVAVR